MTRLTTALAPTDIFTVTSDKRFDLGGLGVTPDGRRFRYVRCNASTATVAGKLYQSTAQTTAWQNLSIAAATAGTYSITTTSTITATKDQLIGGYVAITVTPGQGYLYRIAGNTAASAAVCTITLEDPIQVALTTSSKIDVIMDPYNLIEIWDYTNHDGTPVGVAVSVITAGYYGWVQVGGSCCVLGDSNTVVVGQNVSASTAVDGAVGINGAYTTAPIGTAITGIASTEYGMVYLNMN
jgi:hypothetical protein